MSEPFHIHVRGNFQRAFAAHGRVNPTLTVRHHAHRDRQSKSRSVNLSDMASEEGPCRNWRRGDFPRVQARMLQRVGGGKRVAAMASEGGVRAKLLSDWVGSYRPWGRELKQAGTEAGVEARTGVGRSQGADCRTRVPDLPAADGSALFSRTLAGLGRRAEAAACPPRRGYHPADQARQPLLRLSRHR